MSDDMGVLFVTPEAHPLIKTGGLGDVGGALPTALRHVGVDARLLLPAYPGLIETVNAQPLGAPLLVLAGMLEVQLFHGLMPGGDTQVYLIDAPSLYYRSGPYVDEKGKDWADNAFRFAVLSRVAAMFGSQPDLFDWKPKLIHCNDWQTGLTPAYLSFGPGNQTRTLITLHNMAFQGNFPPRLLPHLDLPKTSYKVQGLEFHGQLSFLKAGLFYADHINAVSPTYAEEIQTSDYGYGLEGLLAQRNDQLSGILNGVDTSYWNPLHDPYLPENYSSTGLAGKAASKLALQKHFGLEQNPDVPLLGIVSRLTRQKGIDLVLAIADQLLAQSVQLAILGSGDSAFESELQCLPREQPGRVGIHIGYDEALAHVVEAGADIFLMPSRFEPCGLNQMYSMLYGTPPVVRHTGGLADSVVDATPSTLADGTATGFVFSGANEAELLACVLRALILFQDRKAWRKIQLAGMQQDFSWHQSAEKYLSLYQSLLSSPTNVSRP